MEQLIATKKVGLVFILFSMGSEGGYGRTFFEKTYTQTVFLEWIGHST